MTRAALVFVALFIGPTHATLKTSTNFGCATDRTKNELCPDFVPEAWYGTLHGTIQIKSDAMGASAHVVAHLGTPKILKDAGGEVLGKFTFRAVAQPCNLLAVDLVRQSFYSMQTQQPRMVVQLSY